MKRYTKKEIRELVELMDAFDRAWADREKNAKSQSDAESDDDEAGDVDE